MKKSRFFFAASLPLLLFLTTANCLPAATPDRPSDCNDSWTATTTVNAPAARQNHTAVWTGSEMIVWGGEDENVFWLNTGGRYDPADDRWTATSTINAPTPRDDHTAVWTGIEMIVWGGSATGGNSNTGGR